MSYYPKMRGEQCYLSPINLDDAPMYTAWLNDLEVTRNLTLSGMMVSEQGERGFLEQLSKEHNYAIVTRDGDKLIGNCGLLNTDQKNRSCEVGIFIGDKAYWGRGFGTEALVLLCGYAFDYLNMRNIMLKVFGFNARAASCYKKVGFRIIGHRRNALQVEGKEYDEIYMDLLDEEFRNLYTSSSE